MSHFRSVTIFIFSLACLSIVCMHSCLDPDVDNLEFYDVVMDPPDPQDLGFMTLSGYVQADDVPFLVDQGFFIAKSREDLETNSGDIIKLQAALSPDGTFDAAWGNISLEDLFHLRAYAVFRDNRVDEDRTVYSEIRLFSFSMVIRAEEHVMIANNLATVEGYIFGLQNLGILVEDHGFLYSDDSLELLNHGIAGADTVSLGSLNDDGIFSGKIKDLAFNTVYYFRAWALAGGTLYPSPNIVSFKVKDGWRPRLNDEPFSLVYPYGGVLNGQGYILGCKDIFGLDCQINGEQPIWRYHPTANNGSGEWSELNPPDAFFIPRFNAFSFVIGDSLYIGYGEYLPGPSLTSDIWVIHKDDIGSTNFKLMIAPEFPPPRTSAVTFVKNGKGYLGTGKDQDGNLLNDFWEYDPSLGQWREVNPMPLQKSPSSGILSNAGRSEAIAFSFENHPDCFIGGGAETLSLLHDYWRFTPPVPGDPDDIGTWSPSPEFFPGPGRINAVSFTVYDKGYVGLGLNFSTGLLNDLWRLDPTAQELFTEVTGFPGEKRFGANGFVINNIAYIGQGQTNVPTPTGGAAPHLLTDMWQYFPETE